METRDWKDSAYDLIVIGSGPGGEGAAMEAAKRGLAVAMVEEQADVGGAGTHSGMIPSKALRHVVQRMQENGTTGWGRRQGDRNWPSMLQMAKEVVRRQVNLRSAFYERNAISRHRGRACFLDAHRISINDEKGQQQGELTARAIIIATGGRPNPLEGLDFSHPRILNTRSLHEMDYSPRSITIVGGGPFACEYASIFRSLSVKVTLLNEREKLLDHLDEEIIEAISFHFREQGVLLRHGEQITEIQPNDENVELTTASNKRILCDALLWARNRRANSEGLGLEELGIETGILGAIQVNEHYQTTQEHIYAVGDVVGAPGLASASYNQGRYAARHLMDGEAPRQLVENIPSAIYTLPEICCVGRTEAQLTEDGVPYEVGQASMRNLARAHITGRTTGLLKLLFHRENLSLLGVHCFGSEAADLVHVGQALMDRREGNSIEYFINAPLNTPSMAEAYRVAAFNGLNRLRGR